MFNKLICSDLLLKNCLNLPGSSFGFYTENTDIQCIKQMSFVVKGNVHFTADYNFLWDSACKCLVVMCKSFSENRT
jgi:hypothetical protein